MKLNLEYIKKRRKEMNISQEDMAVKMGFANASVYCKYENGTYQFNANVLPKLAQILKCKIQNFFG